MDGWWNVAFARGWTATDGEAFTCPRFLSLALLCVHQGLCEQMCIGCLWQMEINFDFLKKYLIKIWREKKSGRG